MDNSIIPRSVTELKIAVSVLTNETKVRTRVVNKEVYKISLLAFY